MGFKVDEQETGLLFDPTTNTWDVITNIPKHIRQYTNIALAHGVEPTVTAEGRLRVTLPAKAVSLRKPTNRKPMTEEQRKAAAERFKKMWADKGLEAPSEETGEDDEE